MPALYLFAIIFITAALDGCSTMPTQNKQVEAVAAFNDASYLDRLGRNNEADAVRKEARRLLVNYAK